MAKKDIIQELNDLGSGLANHSSENIYSVPEGYFEGFAEQVLGRVKAGNEGSEFLSSLPKENPYQVPAGYFDGLEERIMDLIRNHSDYLSPKEELESISPLLKSIRKEPVYSVPQGYFENFQVSVDGKHQTKVVSITNRKWFRLAAAAMFTGIIALSAVLFLSKNRIDPDINPQAWVKKSMKKVSTQDINEFVKLSEEEALAKTSQTVISKPDEIKELMKDVPTNEIDQFLDETDIYEDAGEETLLN